MRIVSSFNSKPNLSKPEQTAQSAHRPPPSDGSDIDHSDPAFFVAHFPLDSSRPRTDASGARKCDGADVATHKLILNKFNVHRPQYLLLTCDPHALQSSPLEPIDLKAAWDVLTKVSEPHYVIYNGGKEAGSSRKHKHMQVLGMPDLEVVKDERGGERARRLMWPHVDIRQREEQLPGLPYAHFFLPLDPTAPCQQTLDALVEKYQTYLKTSREMLRLNAEDDIAHNVIMTKEWFMMIPRHSATADGIRGHAVGAQGMLGLLWCGNQEQIEGWKQVGNQVAMSQLGIPLARLGERS